MNTPSIPSGQRAIVVSVDPLGGSKVEAHNYSGQGCVEATAAIEAALGGSAERTHKGEFHEVVSEEVHQQQSW